MQTSTTLQQAQRIAQRYTLLSLGIALVPLPLVDLATLSALQLAMIRELCHCYEQRFLKHRSHHLMAALMGGGSAVAMARGIGLYTAKHTTPLRWLSLGSVGVLGGVSTQALAKVFILHFEAGGSVVDFDPQRMRAHYQQLLRQQPTPLSADTFVGVRP